MAKQQRQKQRQFDAPYIPVAAECRFWSAKQLDGGKVMLRLSFGGGKGSVAAFVNPDECPGVRVLLRLPTDERGGIVLGDTKGVRGMVVGSGRAEDGGEKYGPQFVMNADFVRAFVSRDQLADLESAGAPSDEGPSEEADADIPF